VALLKKLIQIRKTVITSANRALRKTPGAKRIKRSRKLSGVALTKLISKSKKVDKVDRVINARSRGVKFVRIRGRIVPIRPKRQK